MYIELTQVPTIVQSIKVESTHTDYPCDSLSMKHSPLNEVKGLLKPFCLTVTDSGILRIFLLLCGYTAPRCIFSRETLPQAITMSRKSLMFDSRWAVEEDMSFPSGTNLTISTCRQPWTLNTVRAGVRPVLRCVRGRWLLSEHGYPLCQGKERLLKRLVSVNRNVKFIIPDGVLLDYRHVQMLAGRQTLEFLLHQMKITLRFRFEQKSGKRIMDFKFQVFH